MRILKKYSNRKIYCTKNSKYVTLNELNPTEKFKVVCNKTKKDITKLIKAKIYYSNALKLIEKELDL